MEFQCYKYITIKLFKLRYLLPLLLYSQMINLIYEISRCKVRVLSDIHVQGEILACQTGNVLYCICTIQGWMNEITHYDPEDYHINLTHSIYVTLDGSTLRLQTPKQVIARGDNKLKKLF